MSLDTLTALANTGTGTDTLAGQQTPSGFAGAVVGTDGTNPERLATEVSLAALLSRGNPSSYWPGYSGTSGTGPRAIGIDDDGALSARAAVLTDEGTFRANFANTSYALGIGNVTVAGGVVTGSGFLTADVHYADYFKIDVDAVAAWLQIASVDSDTQITLASPYVGSASGVGQRSIMFPMIGAGGSITVGSGQATITSGTTSDAVTGFKRLTDYAPIVFRSRVSVSQRIANQHSHIGLEENVAVPRWFARFLLDGVTATTVKCETGRNPSGAPSASETETTTITIPNGGNTSQIIDYRVEMLTESVRFYISGVLVAEHVRVIPHQHDEMTSHVEVRNQTGPASSTSIVIDYIAGKNHNKIEIGVMSDSEKIVAAQAPMTAYNFSQAGVIVINTDLLVIDCSQLRSLSIQCTSMGTTGVVTAAWSNDGTTFVSSSLMTPAGAAAATFNAAGIWTTLVYGRYLRLRLTTATTAGTTTLFVNGYQFPVGQPVAQPVSGSVTASIANGTVLGNTAIDGVFPNPIGQGLRAANANPAAMSANGDLVGALATMIGAQVVKPYCIPDAEWTYSNVLTTTGDIAVQAAAGAGLRRHLTFIGFANTTASAVDLVIKDGASTRLQITMPANSWDYFSLPTGIFSTANTALNVALSAASAGIRVNFLGYTGP